MFSGPVRGGTRGGQGDFKWTDVADDKDRENYLGHSILAPVGRWQKNKDITWYNKNGGAVDEDERLKAKREEIQRIKLAEEDALSAALGFKPTPRDPIGSATIQSSSNAIPLAQSRKPDPPYEPENTDRQAEKAARKVERAAKREKKAMAAEEKRMKKQPPKSSRHGERDLEKSGRLDSFQERPRDRNGSYRRNLPEREPEENMKAERTRERDHPDRRTRPRRSDDNLGTHEFSPCPRSRSVSSESAHAARDSSYHRQSRRSHEYYHSNELHPSKSFSHSKHWSRSPSPFTGDRYRASPAQVEQRRQGRPRSRSPHRSRRPSPQLRGSHRRSTSPAERRRERRNCSRSPRRSPSSSPRVRAKYNRPPSPVEPRRRHRARSPPRSNDRDY